MTGAHGQQEGWQLRGRSAARLAAGRRWPQAPACRAEGPGIHPAGHCLASSKFTANFALNLEGQASEFPNKAVFLVIPELDQQRAGSLGPPTNGAFAPGSCANVLVELPQSHLPRCLRNHHHQFYSFLHLAHMDSSRGVTRRRSGMTLEPEAHYQSEGFTYCFAEEIKRQSRQEQVCGLKNHN